MTWQFWVGAIGLYLTIGSWHVHQVRVDLGDEYLANYREQAGFWRYWIDRIGLVLLWLPLRVIALVMDFVNSMFWEDE